MKLKDLKPGFYLLKKADDKTSTFDNSATFVEARDASQRPDSWFGEGVPKLEFFYMGWDVGERYKQPVDEVTDEFEPAMAISIKEYNQLLGIFHEMLL